MRNRFNICSASDSYKFGHWDMLPDGTQFVYDYFESRNEATFDRTVFAGLQGIIKDFLVGEVVTPEKVMLAKRRVNSHLMDQNAFNLNGWLFVCAKHNGRLPVMIKAVPEGTPVPTGNVLMTVEGTDSQLPWIGPYLEPLLTHVWYPSTVASLSRETKVMMKKFLDATSDKPEALDFMLHDFGFRGVSSFGSGEIGGFGHLINFKGTDTFPSIEYILDNYSNGLADDYMPAYSVKATEHGVMISLGRSGEMDIVERLLKKYPIGIISVVIDSYDHVAFIKEVIKRFKDDILKRDGKFVFRPDSGTPNEVTIECFELIEAGFGSRTNSKGYMELNEKVGLLWGDGINRVGIEGILYTLKNRGIAADCMVFGMGGGLLQKVNRDTQRFAFKPSYMVIDGEGREVYKDPVAGNKTSKKGKLAIVQTENGFKTVSYTGEAPGGDLLEPVFINGQLIRDMNFEEVRYNARIAA